MKAVKLRVRGQDVYINKEDIVEVKESFFGEQQSQYYITLRTTQHHGSLYHDEFGEIKKLIEEWRK